MNRVQTIVDGVGTTSYSFTSGGMLQSEDGPWPNDTVTYSYQNRLRTGLNLQAPNASDWVQSYGYDGAKRLMSLTSPAGTFSYAYDSARQTLVGKLNLPNGAYITNSYDSVSRLLSTVLKNSGNAILNSHSYGYNLGSQRTSLTNVLGDYRNYGYDKIGQLQTAFGFESNSTARVNEKFGYAYDSAGNLNYRTNNDLLQTFTVNSLNELSTLSRNTTMTVEGTTTSPATSATVNSVAAIRYADNTFARTNVSLADGLNTFTASAQDSSGRTDSSTAFATLPASANLVYDLNGNLRTNANNVVTFRIYDYDDENQLIRVTEPGAWKSEFTYDGKLRRRIRREFTWQNAAWVQTKEVRYVYDGNLVILERDANNLPTLAYSRGRDLSGSLQGAGGIGGLLAFSQLSTIAPQHAYYQADGNGNVTILLSFLQLSVAKYLYDPFGNMLSASGPLSDANLYRFSSKEVHAASGLIYYLYRYFEPNSQRWLNRDLLEEAGGINLYLFAGNGPIQARDPYGLDPRSDLLAAMETAAQTGDTAGIETVLEAWGDDWGRLTSTTLYNSTNTSLNSHSYSLNEMNQRWSQARSYGASATYGYDALGQLTSASEEESLLRGQLMVL